MTENRKKIGKVYLIGAGPGDPDLITVKGKKLLGRAEVVIYDYLASSKLLKYVPVGAKRIYAGKRGGVKHTHTQDEINAMLIDHALAGATVVRLKGGDPFIFGRGGEELEELIEAGVPFEVVPGVTSATAAATYAGVPITHRAYTSSVAFVTGHEDPSRADSRIAWDKLATGVGTLVFYMGIKNLENICDNLIKNGRDPATPVVVVRWASTPKQKSVSAPLKDIAAVVRRHGLRPPALVVVGDVVKLRDNINWYEKRPLFGRRVLVTRTREQASSLVELLRDQGADCLEGSTISLVAPENWDSLDRAIDGISDFDWLVFTSINAITFFFRRLAERNLDARHLAGAKIAVVGTATAEELRRHGINADLIPDEFTGDGLATALLKNDLKGKKILLPRAEKAREILPERLVGAGAGVDVVPVYRNVRPDSYDKVRDALQAGEIDMVTFTSSSTVKNFVAMLGGDKKYDIADLIKDVRVACIGPITSRTARELGLKVEVEPDEYTIPAMVAAIVDFYGKEVTRVLGEVTAR